MPSKDNYQSFRKKVKSIVNCSNIGSKVKAKKLAPVIRGWRNYHRYCDMSKHPLWDMTHRAYTVFNKEEKNDRYSSKKLKKQAFPAVTWAVNKHINVKGNKSPYDGDIVYWSKRNSNKYNSYTAKALKKQCHKCDSCNLSFIDNEPVHLHHKDGNHSNWKANNLCAVHQSCHQYIHIK